MDPVIQVRSAVVLLDRFPALAGADLTVAPGEILWLSGPNGAGKTTLLRLCAGLVPLVTGSAEVLGVDLSQDRRSVRRSIGLLGHASGLYEELSVIDNLRFWARAVKADPGQVHAALRRVNLAERAWSIPVLALSSGQRRRAALAAMVLRRPRVWLLDEPHAGLDASARDLVDDLVTEASRVGATVVFASHETDRAQRIATRSVWVDGGTVSEMATVGSRS